MEREERREMEQQHMLQMQRENKIWAPVDKEDAKHLQKISKKNKQEAVKAAKL